MLKIQVQVNSHDNKQTVNHLARLCNQVTQVQPIGFSIPVMFTPIVASGG